ncbi:MAG: hypothetical protein SAK29_31470, partial [Scytonema sp. PMC 1069.18]|nr:hypothetical protein [Scytonema sp. PMC 1069.18]
YKIASLSQQEDRKLFHSFNIAICVLIFSLVQHENWLWGFQIAWFLINTCVILSIFFIFVPTKLLPKWRLSLAAVCCTIASFSCAHGLLSWLALIPSVVSIEGSLKQKRMRTLIWILLFVLSATVYFIGYQKPSHNNKLDIFFLLEQWQLTLKYLLTLIGISIGKGVIPSYIIGLIILGNFVFFNGYILTRQDSKTFSKVAPWLSLGWYATLFSMITTVGRAGFGIEQATSSRYSTVTTLLVVSVLQIWRLMLPRRRKGLTKSPFRLSKGTFLAGFLTVVFVMHSLNAIAAGKESWERRIRGAACLELIQVLEKSATEQFNNCLELIYPFTNQLAELAKTLDKLDFREFLTTLSFVTTPQENYGYIDIPATAAQPVIVSKKDSIEFAGWAILPQKQEQPKVVLLSYGTNQLFLANAVVQLDRPDVAKALNSSLYQKSGWSVNVSPSLIPTGETVVKAWVYDSKLKQFIKLNGEPKIKVVE